MASVVRGEGVEGFGDRRGDLLPQPVGQRSAVDRPDQLLGQVVEFGVGALRGLDQDAPGVLGVQTEGGHQDPTGQIDDRPGLHGPFELADFDAQVLLGILGPPALLHGAGGGADTYALADGGHAGTGVMGVRKERPCAGEREQALDRDPRGLDADRLGLRQGQAADVQQDVEAGAVTEVDPGEVEVEAVDRLGQCFTQGMPQRLLGVDVEFTRDHHNRPLTGGICGDLQERRGVGSNRAIRQRLVDGFVTASRLGRKMFWHGVTPGHPPVFASSSLGLPHLARQELHEPIFTLLNA
jgi:hypothetical protein